MEDALYEIESMRRFAMHVMYIREGNKLFGSSLHPAQYVDLVQQKLPDWIKEFVIKESTRKKPTRLRQRMARRSVRLKHFHSEADNSPSDYIRHSGK